MGRLLDPKPLTLVFAGGSAVFISSVTAFGIRAGLAPVAVANGLLTVVILLFGLAVLAWAVATAAAQRRHLLPVGIVVAASLFAGMAMFVIALQPDPIPFLSIMASGVLSMFLTWAFTNSSGNHSSLREPKRRRGGRRVVSSRRAKNEEQGRGWRLSGKHS